MLVWVENDVNVFLFGEVVVEGCVEVDVFGVMFGIGVGGVFFIDGEFYYGLYGVVGEIGYIFGYSDLVCMCG